MRGERAKRRARAYLMAWIVWAVAKYVPRVVKCAYMKAALELTKELAERIAANIADGLPIEYACDICGTRYKRYAEWMRKGEEDEANGVESVEAFLHDAVKRSYALFIRSSRDVIRAGKAGWQGTAWWLERTNAKFMPRQQVQADDEGKVTVVIGGKRIDPKTRLGDPRVDDPERKWTLQDGSDDKR